jgi:hypothetical protein
MIFRTGMVHRKNVHCSKRAGGQIVTTICFGQWRIEISSNFFINSDCMMKIFLTKNKNPLHHQ